MKEFIEKLIVELKENSFDMSLENPDCKAVWIDKAIKIVNQLAEEIEKDPNWQTTRKYLDVKYFSKIRELSAKYNYPCENVPINFDWVFGLIDKMEVQLAEEYKPKTQADKIRAMNDEELAEFLYGLDHYWDDGQCILRINDNHLNDYKDDILDWLQSEAETKGE